MTGDVGTSLVRRSNMTPIAVEDECLRSHIVRSTCTIRDKVCRFIIDTINRENIISTEAVHKLGLETEQLLKPYKPVWLKKWRRGNCLQTSLSFLFYLVNCRDFVWCDLITVNVRHLLLGSP